jgi:hypothetical protein
MISWGILDVVAATTWSRKKTLTNMTGEAVLTVFPSADKQLRVIDGLIYFYP